MLPSPVTLLQVGPRDGLLNADIHASLEIGVHYTFDVSIAGRGGCPYAKGATGDALPARREASLQPAVAA